MRSTRTIALGFLLLIGVSPHAHTAEPAKGAEATMKAIREEMKEKRLQISRLRSEKSKFEAQARNPKKGARPEGVKAGGCDCSTCEPGTITSKIFRGQNRQNVQVQQAVQEFQTSWDVADASGKCDELISRFGGSERVLESGLPTGCLEQIKGCPEVSKQIYKQEQLNYAENKQSEIESTEAELKELTERLKSERAEQTREYERCPECALIKAMQPRTPGVGDYILGAIQGITPVVTQGVNAWAYAKSWSKYAGMYDSYLDQCTQIGVPCVSPEQALYGNRTQYGVPYNGNPWGQNCTGWSCGGSSNSSVGVFGPNGFGPLSSPNGQGSLFGNGGGAPFFGPSFNSGFQGGANLGLDVGWGMQNMALGTGYNSAAFPFGPIGTYANGQQQASFSTSMQSYMGASQLAMSNSYSSMMAEQALMEAQRRYYETVYSAWNSGLSGFNGQAGAGAPQLPR